MNINDVRTKYLEFFSACEHMPVPSSSLVPGNDPTTLFTGSGMQPLIPYLLGKEHALGIASSTARSVSARRTSRKWGTTGTSLFSKCSAIGRSAITSKEQLPWLFEFLTSGDRPRPAQSLCDRLHRRREEQHTARHRIRGYLETTFCGQRY